MYDLKITNGTVVDGTDVPRGPAGRPDPRGALNHPGSR